MEKQNLIHEKGFAMTGAREVDPYAPKDYSKIRVGLKVLEDAILDIGFFNKIKNVSVSKERLMEALANSDYSELRQISNYFYKASGIYQRLCKYLATLYRYDWYCIPYMVKEDIKEDKILKDFTELLKYLDNSNIKKLLGDIALEVLKEGCYYGYIGDSQDCLTLQQLPSNYCRTKYSIGNQPAIEFNMKYFDDSFKDINYRLKVLKLFPKEFQKGYRLYIEKKLKPEYMGDKDGWYLLDVDKTVKFNINDNDFPAFITVIPAIIDLDSAQEIDRKRMMQQLLKIIIQKLPMDKNGDLIFDVDEARDIHNNAVTMLKRAIGTDVLTTFADVEVADLSSSRESAAMDNLERVERGVYNAAGISNNLFNTQGNTALDRSIANDESSMRGFVLQCQDFINKAIKSFNKNSKKYYFRVILLETTQYNYKDISKLYKEQTQLGYSKMLPQVALGHSQSEILASITFEENILHLSEIMKPPMMSSTMSGKKESQNEKKLGKTNKNQLDKNEDDIGRPELEDAQKSDKTLANREAEQ